MGEHSYLYWYISPFPTKTPVTPEWMGAAFCKFVYVLRSYNRTKWKKESKKTSENSYLYWYTSPFPTKTLVTPERLGAAFRKFVYAFRSYNRTK